MKVSVLFPIVALLFHQSVIAKASHVPGESETFETSLFSPQSSSSPYLSTSSTSEPSASNFFLESRASPLYTLLNQRKMEQPVPSSSADGCTNEQLIGRMAQPDILVNAIKLYIDSYGLEATKSLLNPILGLSDGGNNSDLKDNKVSDSRARIGNDVTSQEDSTSDQSYSSQEAFGESFRGAIDIGVNLPHGHVMTGHPGQGDVVGIISNPLLSTRIGESLPALPLNGPYDGHSIGGSNTGSYRSLVSNRMSPFLPGRERVLLIPGRRLRPFSSKVRISANGKVREVKITVAPFMNILSALRQAEQQIQWKFPELATRKVIEIGSLDDNSKENLSSSCYSVTKVGPIEANEEHFWTIKLTLKSGEVKFEGSCLPSTDTDDLRVRPGSTIDLNYH